MTSGRSKPLVTGLGRHFRDHRVTSPYAASLINTDEGAYGYDILRAPWRGWAHPAESIRTAQTPGAAE